MSWWQSLLPASPHRLRAAGVLGMNRRNADLINEHNPRDFFPQVDDKVLTKEICQRKQVPIPDTYGVISGYGEIDTLPVLVAEHPDFVIKPAHGAGGRGILVVLEHRDDTFRTASRETLQWTELRYHVSSILAGLFSLGGRVDSALVEQRIVRHPEFDPIAVGGTPDIRIIIYRRVPVMAMVRLPTKASRGRANLHQGAVGAGIDLLTGRTLGGVCRDEAVAVHPDTGGAIAGFAIPMWSDVLAAAMLLGDALELGYVGVDLVIDAARGPLVLEANARPGLAIQIANRRGLGHRLAYVDRHQPVPIDFGGRLAYVRNLLQAEPAS